MTTTPVHYSLTSVGVFFITYHVLLAIALPIYFYHTTPSVGVVVCTFILLGFCGHSIGAYHRHYAHKGYKLNRFVEYFFVFFGTLTVQGSVLAWAHDHRIHHKFTDKPQDPYGITKGFWHAHILWLFDRSVYERDYKKYVPDLMSDPLLRFQEKYYNILALSSNILVCGIIGIVFKDMWGAFLIAGWLRIFAVHHATFFVNSIAHVWGSHTYLKELSAVDNAIVAFLTFGEGYHNYHHAFQHDYRNGIRWYHFDPNKWLVWTLHKCGLAYDLRRYDESSIRHKLVDSDHALLLATIERLRSKGDGWCESRRKEVNELANALRNAIEEIRNIATKMHEVHKANRKALAVRLRKQQQEFTATKHKWNMLCRELIGTQPA